LSSTSMSNDARQGNPPRGPLYLTNTVRRRWREAKWVEAKGTRQWLKEEKRRRHDVIAGGTFSPASTGQGGHHPGYLAATIRHGLMKCFPSRTDYLDRICQRRSASRLRWETHQIFLAPDTQSTAKAALAVLPQATQPNSPVSGRGTMELNLCSWICAASNRRQDLKSLRSQGCHRYRGINFWSYFTACRVRKNSIELVTEGEA